MIRKFSESFSSEPKNECCPDWPVAEVKFCTDDGQFDLPCGEEMRDMFGTFTYLQTPFEFTSSVPKMIQTSSSMHGCAGSCQRVIIMIIIIKIIIMIRLRVARVSISKAPLVNCCFQTIWVSLCLKRLRETILRQNKAEF